MMKTATARLALASLALLGVGRSGIQPAAAAPAPQRCSERANGGPEIAFGLTADQRLICFKVNRPREQATLIVVSQLQSPDTRLIGMDTRPATGAIWALGNGGGLYVLDPATARVEFKSRLTVALDSASVGLDFNPTVDRLRVVTDTGQNLRVNVDTGATTVDGFLRSGSTRMIGVGGAAYTNNDNDPSTGTTLYDLDTVMDQLVTQNPPNDGVLNPVGRLSFQGSSAAAFDIVSALTDGKVTSNTGYAALDGGDVLFSIDLISGRATFVGDVGTKLVGLTFPTV
jgi:Domain of unknown function (DUF4394)